MKTLAVCFYGIKLADSVIIDLVLEKFKEYDISIFNECNPTTSVALLKVAHRKHSEEILNKHDYDICMAVHTSAHNLIQHTTIKNLEPNFLYFTKGYFNEPDRSTGVSKEIFYATSLTFDRACEFKINLNYIDKRWLRSQGPEALFYYHLKSLNIRTECIDCENSHMFIRTT